MRLKETSDKEYIKTMAWYCVEKETRKGVYNLKKKAESLDNIIRGGNCEM